MRAFWDVAPCSLVGVDRRFRGAYCLHYQDGEYHPLIIIDHPDDEGSTETRLLGVISQKALIFMRFCLDIKLQQLSS
jgi:hypothetical protein